MVHLRGPHQRPDLLADRGQLGRVERGDVGVLVEQLLEPGDVAVGLGARHRRDQVVDQRGVRAALGLGALARVVDQERVDQRQVAERGVGAAGRGHAQRLAGQPLQVAVLAEVHDRVGAEPVASREPAVGGQVVVARRQVRVVVDRDRVLAEPARRLHHQHDVAGLQCGDDDLAVGIVAAVDEQLAGRRAPVLVDGVAQLGGQRREPLPVVAWRTSGSGCPPAAPRSASPGPGRRAAISAWISASPSLGVDARASVADVVAGVAHRAQQRDRAGRGVQADGVADPGVLGRVGREHQRDPLVGGRDVPQPGVPHRDARRPGRRARGRRRRRSARRRRSP